MRRALHLLSVTVALGALAGCSTPPRADASANLIARPDFPAAASSAPEWVRAALREITRLEEQIERAPAR
jgi:hypothetical protein